MTKPTIFQRLSAVMSGSGGSVNNYNIQQRYIEEIIMMTYC